MKIKNREAEMMVQLYVHKVTRFLHINISIYRRIIIAILLATCCLSLIVRHLYANIATTFSDLILENLEIGGSYNLRALKNCPMVIKNNSDASINVEIKIDIPAKENLMSSYEPIPDVEWIKIVPAKYRLEPFGKNSSDLIITIPNDEKLMGRHFQAQILSSSLPAGGLQSQLTIATGFQSRIRFSIGSMGPKTLETEKKRKKMMSLNFEIDPVNIVVKQPIKLGKKIDLREEYGTRLTLINRATESVLLNMVIVSERKDMPAEEKNYEVGDPKFLEIKPKKLVLDGESLKKLNLYLKIPDEEKYKDKKYFFVIKAEVPGEVPVEVFSKLYITTEK
ncbi:MAG: hypothetical protein ABID79_03150 [Elusimicrobiota bacterium]